MHCLTGLPMTTLSSPVAARHRARSRENFGVGTASKLTTSGTQAPAQSAAANISTSVKILPRIIPPQSCAIIRHRIPDGNWSAPGGPPGQSAQRGSHTHVDGAHALALRAHDQRIDLDVGE